MYICPLSFPDFSVSGLTFAPNVTNKKDNVTPIIACVLFFSYLCKRNLKPNTIMDKKLFTVILFALLGISASVKAATDYCLCATTTQAHENIADDQVTYTPSVALKKGKKYICFVTVKATEACKLSINPAWSASPNKNEAGESTDVQELKSISVTKEWKTVRRTFTAEYNLDEINFLFGGLNGNFYIDDIQITEDSVGVNIVQNGNFSDKSTMGWSTKTEANGTTISLVETGSTGTTSGEPWVPETWEYVQQGDPNFQIYLAFGQSNMEGNAKPEEEDMTCPERFQMLAAVDFSSPKRSKGNWYTAIPPLCRQGTGLTPCDYFGRYLVENLPDSVKIGVCNVAVGGAKIELFMEEYKDDYIAGEADWFKNYCKQYDNDPLGRLIEMGKIAQKVGTIKGILLHQGESNNGASDWCEKVSKVYNRICYNLGLNPAETPLLAGETLYADQGGGCSWHNQAALPHLKEWVPNSYVISAEGIPGNGVDAWHFSAAGYRELGKRYGEQMLEILNDQAAGITLTPALTREAEGIYNLSGQKIKEMPKHGIVIVNGKKIIK